MLPIINEVARTPRPCQRADPRREMRRLRRLLRTVRQPGARPRRRPAGSPGGTVLITEVPEFCGAEHILAQRVEGSRDGRSRVPDGGLVQGLCVEVRHGARREPEPRQRRRRPPQHHHQVARRHRQGRHARASRASLGYARGAAGQRAVADAGAGLRPGVDAGTRGAPAPQVVVFTTGRGTTIGNAIAPVVKLASNTAGASADVARHGPLGRRHHRRHRNDRAGRRARVRSRHPRRLRRGASRRPRKPSTASSKSGPSSRSRCDDFSGSGLQAPDSRPGWATSHNPEPSAVACRACTAAVSNLYPGAFGRNPSARTLGLTQPWSRAPGARSLFSYARRRSR